MPFILSACHKEAESLIARLLDYFLDSWPLAVAVTAPTA